MPKLKLTKTVVDSAQPQGDAYELRDTTVPGFLLKVTPTGRKIFMMAYLAHNGQRRKPAIGRLGEITVEQARDIARTDWLKCVKARTRASNARRPERLPPSRNFSNASWRSIRKPATNPCRHVPKYPERGETRLITEFRTQGAFRLQFELAARMSEILTLEWSWVDLDDRRVEWPDSKTGSISKPMSAEAVRLFETAPRFEDSPYVCPSVFDPNPPMPKHTYWQGWARCLERTGLPAD